MKKYLFLLLLFVLSLCFIFPYFFCYHYIIPIDKLNSYKIPCATIEIEGNRYSVEIDLGSKTALSLHSDVLRKIQKESIGVSKRIDFQGNYYETKAFLIPQVQLGSLVLKKARAKEEAISFSTTGSIIQSVNEPTYAGRVGRDLFSGKNIFMDFQNGFFAVTNDVRFLKQKGYNLFQSVQTSFEFTSDGIIFECDTDLGCLHLILDTGSTLSVIRKPKNNGSKDSTKGIPLFSSSKFSISGVNFGPKEFGLIQLSDEYKEIDGLLGMDFLKEHFVYLDFKKNRAYFGTRLAHQNPATTKTL